MAQFNANIDLEVLVRSKQLDELEKRLSKLNQFTVGGGTNKEFFDVKNAVAYNNLVDGILEKLVKISRFEKQYNRTIGPQRGNANQYSGPIGPGQASPSRLSSSLAIRRNQEIQQRSRGLNQFPLGVPAPEQDPVRDEQRRAKIIARNIILRRRERAIARSTARIREQGLSKAVFQTKLELQLATKLRGVEAQITKEQQKQISAQQSLARQREKAIDKASRQYRKPIGPELPKAKGGGRSGGGAGGGLAAGIGFPLLFGSGPGSILGGAIGSAGGFGTQILASAIGGIVDQAVAGVAKLGQALNPLTADIDAVVAAAGESNTAFEQLVKDLEKVAGKEKALAAATAQLAVVIGQDGVSALRQFGDESAELGRVYAQTLSQISAAVAGLINSSGLLLALAQQIERTNLINAAARNDTKDPELTDLNQELSRANRGQVEEGRSISIIEDELIARQRIVESIRERNIAEEAGASIAKVNAAVSKSMLATAENELAISRINAGLENDKVFALKLQGIELKRNEEINQNILDLNNKQITRQQALANQTAINARAEAARNNLENDRIKAQETLANKAANEQKRLAREAEQAAKKELRVRQQLEQSDIKRYDIKIDLIRVTQGEEAAIKEQLIALDDLVLKRIKVVELSGKDLRLQEAEITIIREAAAVDKVRLLNKLQEIDLQRKLNKLKAEQQVDAVQTGLDQELAGLSLGGNDQTDLLQEQANRYANTLKDINNQIEQQNLLIENTPTPNQEAINAATTQLDVLKKTKGAYEAMLPQIFAAEQAQLKYNQAFAAITPAVNSLVSGLQDVVAGTKTAEEAFADFLNTIADQLINTAATMIAQYLAIAAAKAIAGLSGNSSIRGVSPTAIEGAGAGMANMLMPPGRASGGPVAGGQPYIVGEKGPELFIPGVTGTVTNNDQFDAARNAMSGGGGGGGSSAETGGLGSEGMSSAFAENTSSISTTNSYMRERAMETNNQTTIGGAGTMTIETQVINNVEYASVEQVAKASALAAKQARAQVFADLRSKPSRRASVGLK